MTININELKQNNDYIVNLRRQLHEVPELGTYLPKTQQIVIEELEKLGIEYKKNAVEFDGKPDSGIIALIEGSAEGKCIALRADMDALPIQEMTDLEFKSSHEGKMHACGHDCHTSMLLGAAKLLVENKDKFSGTVKLIFQTSEEIITGAKLMIEQGAMENPKVDAIIGMHIWPYPEHETGQILTKHGTLMASGDQLKIHLEGKGVHGYNPDRGIDPIVNMSEVISSLQKIRSREFPVDEGMVLSICQVHAGTAWNIIPDTAWAEGTVRTLSNEKRDFAKQRIEEMVENISKANRIKGSVEWVNGTPAVENDPDLLETAEKATLNALGPDSFQHLEKPVMGNEDVSWYFQHAPGCFAFLNFSNKEKGFDTPLHSPELAVDEEILWKGSAFMACTAIEYLNNN